jgi:putative ABC transport system permease protein
VDGALPRSGADAPVALTNSATPGYFQTLRIPLVAGRDFDDRDAATAPPVAIVSAALAQREWPGQLAIGRRVRMEGDSVWRTVVGVVREVKHLTLTDVPPGTIYAPYAQSPGIFSTVVARTTQPAELMGPAVRAAIWAVDRDQPVWKIRTLESLVGRALGQPRFTMRLVGAFAAAALLLATIGIYGVVSYSVTQRSTELGIRLALGARRAGVLGLVVRQGMALAVVAVAVGVLGALGAARVLQSQLFGVTTTDPVVFVSVPLVVLTVALLATYVPARRASRLDPMTALRSD